MNFAFKFEDEFSVSEIDMNVNTAYDLYVSLVRMSGLQTKRQFDYFETK